MTLGEWDGLAPVAAAIALAVLALMPNRPQPAAPDADDRLGALEGAAAGEGVPWSDSASGQRGTLVPAAIFRGENGQWCREYRVTIEGDTVETEHLACRMAQGGWRDRPGSLIAKAHHRIEQVASAPN